MGRMLETLKLGESRRMPLTVSKPADAAPVQDCVTDWEIAEEVPFVEVGGPNKKVELSAGLMKHAPQPAPQPPHMPVEKTAAPAKVVNLIDVPPLSVTFEPWQDVPPPVKISPDVVAYHQPDHPTTQEYADLFGALRGESKSTGSQVLLLIGLKPHVKAQTVLLNLATIAALKHQLKVAVIDGSEAMAQKLDLTPSVSLHDVVAGTLALEQAIVKTAMRGLHLLPAGKAGAVRTKEVTAWLMTWLRERYDLILIDGASMEDEASLAMQIPHADASYLVLPHNESASVAKDAARSISVMGGQLRGLIHTHFE